jgi:hypothetical protein
VVGCAGGAAVAQRATSPKRNCFRCFCFSFRVNDRNGRLWTGTDGAPQPSAVRIRHSLQTSVHGGASARVCVITVKVE